MAQERRESKADVSFAFTRESFHLVFAVAPVIALIITTLMGKTRLMGTETHLVIEVTLIALVVAVNFYILSRKPDVGGGEQLSPLRTFWTNDLLPSQSGDQQTYNVTVAIIEDEKAGYFRDAVQNRFKTELNLEQLKNLLSKETKSRHSLLRGQRLESLVLEEVKDHHLFFQPIGIDPLRKGSEEQLRRELKKRLDSDLTSPTAVIVVRTAEFNNKPWVYKAVIDWAYRHSEVPILIAKDPTQDFSDNELAKNFLWIPDDPKSLPWRLLQRAKDRARAWRITATYNRAMVWNILYILLMCFYIGAIWFNAKREEFSARMEARDVEISVTARDRDERLATLKSAYNNTLSGMDEAVTMEKAYRALTSKQNDPKLSVSYWYGRADEPYVFVTTENPHTTTHFKKDYETIIGCGFTEPNHVIEGSVGAGKDGKVKVVAYDNYNNVVPMPDCKMLKLRTSEIKSVVCATYNDTSDSGNTGRTVGICVLTEDETNNIFGEKNRRFLIERTRQFHKYFIGPLENNNVMALADRGEDKSSAHK